MADFGASPRLGAMLPRDQRRRKTSQSANILVSVLPGHRVEVFASPSTADQRQCLNSPRIPVSTGLAPRALYTDGTFAVDLWRFAKPRFCGGYAWLCCLSKDYTAANNKLPQAHPRKLLHSGRHVLGAQCSLLGQSALSLLVILLLSPDFPLLYTFKHKGKELVSLSLQVFQLSSFVEPRLFILVDLNPSPAHYAFPPLKVDGACFPKVQPRYTPCRTLLPRRRRSNRLYPLQIRPLTRRKITAPMSLGLPLTVTLALRKMDPRVV